MVGNPGRVLALGRIDGTAATVATVADNGGIGTILDNAAGDYTITAPANEEWPLTECLTFVSAEGTTGIYAYHNRPSATTVQVETAATSTGTHTDAIFNIMVIRANPGSR